MIAPEWIERLRAGQPELPEAKQRRYVAELGLSLYDARLLTDSREIATYFEAVLAHLAGEPATSEAAAKIAANWINGEMAARLNLDGRAIDASSIGADVLARLVARILDGTISNAGAKLVFEDLWNAPQNHDGSRSLESVDAIIEAKQLRQMSDAGALEAVIDDLLATSPSQLADYRAGKEKLFGYFVGQAMKATGGRANPSQLNELLRRKLAG